MFCGLVPKDLFKGGWSLVKSCFKQNYCHTCHTHKVCRFLSSPVPLRKLNIREANLFRIQIEGQRNWGSGEPTSVLRWLIQWYGKNFGQGWWGIFDFTGDNEISRETLTTKNDNPESKWAAFFSFHTVWKINLFSKVRLVVQILWLSIKLYTFLWNLYTVLIIYVWSQGNDADRE